MPLNDFKGAAKPLDKFDIPMLAHRIAVSEDHMQAFINVESRGQGFDRAGRPIILPEPHVFYRQLKGAARDQAVADGLAYPKWGQKPYPKTQDERYEWLERAARIDLRAALMACSWGSTQVLGENYAMIGYSTPEQMVLAFMDDEENHVEAMVNYILATGIADDIRAGRWATVARIYNGPGYAKNGYDKKLAAEYRKLARIEDSGWKPDAPDQVEPPSGEELKAIQRRLRTLGYLEVGTPDGAWGTKTRAAVLAFRADHGLPIYAGVDETFKAALMTAGPREIGEARRTATVEDLRSGGSKTIEKTDKTNGAAAVLGVGSVLGAGLQGVESLTDNLDIVNGLFEKMEPIKEMLAATSPWVLGAIAVYIIYQQFGVQRARVDDHRTGKNAGPDKHDQIEVAR